MIRASHLRAVIFDMDGLMLDTEVISCQAWRLAGDTFGITIDDAVVLAMVGRNTRDCEALLASRLGPNPPAALLMTEWHRCYEILLARGIPTKPGLFELLDFLATRGLPLAVATSTRRIRARTKLEHAGIAGRFATVVAGDDVRRGKPAPDAYATAAARLGVPVARCLALEDSTPGIDAARAAGMAAILVPDLIAPARRHLAAGVKTARSLGEVHAWLAGD